MELCPQRALDRDRHAMETLLRECGLSSLEILAPGTLCWVCRTGRVLAGICGMEVGDRCALLEASRPDLQDVYLFSKDTGGYFERLGRREVPVAEAAARLSQAPQVRRYEEVGWYPDERAFVRRVSMNHAALE